MSMLAEPRRKQKFFLNPQGKQWSEDQNKWGQKMLEKMGWSSGKGLGVNQQGMTDHVRVAVKNDKAGFGLKGELKDEAWTENQDGFNELLQSLQQSQDVEVTKGQELSGKSLELKSKQSRARVHYQKFTRGKDVNKYSSKDLANIFGQKHFNEDLSKSENDSSTEPKSTIVTKNGGSITDYLKNKLPNFMKSKCKEPLENDENKLEKVESENTTVESQVNKGSKKRKKHCVFENPTFDCEDNSSPMKKPKHTDPCYDNLNFSCEIGKIYNGQEFEVSRTSSGFSNQALDVTEDEMVDEKPRNTNNKIKRSKTGAGIANESLDLNDEHSNKKHVSFNDKVEYNIELSDKKKKKCHVKLDKFEVERSKKSKKRQIQNDVKDISLSSYVNEALNIDMTDENVEKKKKSKKKKRRRITNLETIEEVPELEKDETICTMEETMEVTIDNDLQKKKKKKKKEKIETDSNEQKQVDDIITVENGCSLKKSLKNESLATDGIETIKEKQPVKFKNTEKIIINGQNEKKHETSGDNERTKSDKLQPWNGTRMSKKVLKSFYRGNSILHFPGSNIIDIKGYGVDFGRDS